MTPAKPDSDQDIVIQITRNFTDIDFSSTKIINLIKTVCNRFGENNNSNTVSQNTKYEISIVIVDDIEFQELNQKFLNHNTISDCLSFDLSDELPGSPKTFELVLNGQLALRQAQLRGHSDEAELALYITHGLLHNFGFDDLEPEKAKKMHETEDEILQALGYGLVYNTERKETQDSKNK